MCSNNALIGGDNCVVGKEEGGLLLSNQGVVEIKERRRLGRGKGRPGFLVEIRMAELGHGLSWTFQINNQNQGERIYERVGEGFAAASFFCLVVRWEQARGRHRRLPPSALTEGNLNVKLVQALGSQDSPWALRPPFQPHL